MLLNTSNSSVTAQSVGSTAAPSVTLNATESKASIVDGDWCNCEVCNVSTLYQTTQTEIIIFFCGHVF